MHDVDAHRACSVFILIVARFQARNSPRWHTVVAIASLEFAGNRSLHIDGRDGQIAIREQFAPQISWSILYETVLYLVTTIES